MTDEGTVTTSLTEGMTETTAKGISASVGDAADEAMKAVRNVSDQAMKAVEEAADKAMKSFSETGHAADEEVPDIPDEAFADESSSREPSAGETPKSDPPLEGPFVSSLPDDTPPAEPPKKSKKGILIGVLIAILAAALIGGFLYVKYFVPKEIHISSNELELKVGESEKLTYTITPESADNLEVAWATSNEGVATIDEFGVVNAVAGGRCVIAVATGNGKTDTCIVNVTDPAQVQKESLNAVREFISSSDTENEDGVRVLSVRELDDSHSFLIGSDEESLYLLCRTTGAMEDLGVDANYTTYVRMTPENIDTAEVTQKDTLTLYNLPITMEGSGIMNLASYQYGDPVALDSISSSVDGLDAADALHELTDSGVSACINEFEQFLEEQNFGFTVSEFGLTAFEALKSTGEEAPAAEIEEVAVESEPASEEAAAESEPASEETAVESEPVSEEAVAESEPVSEEAAVESEAVSGEAAAESEAASEEAAVESEPVSEENEPESEAAGEETGAEEAATDETKAVQESTGETGEAETLSETTSEAASAAAEADAVTDSETAEDPDAEIPDADVNAEADAEVPSAEDETDSTVSVFSSIPPTGKGASSISFAEAKESLIKTPSVLIAAI
jgi:hypothetical protein